MALVNRGSLIEKAKRAFGILSQGFGSTVSDELVGVTLIGDVTGSDQISVEYPRFALGSEVTGAAVATNAEFAAIQPVDSGIWSYIEAAYVLPSAAGTIQVRFGTIGGLTESSEKAWRNLAVPGAPSLFIGNKTNPTLEGALVGRFRSAGTEPFLIPLGVMIPPTGQGLIIAAQTQNVSLTVTLFWKEILQRDQE